ncbi:MAG: ribose 5-phosphate isomerase B [Dehalococcoidia bacterium]|nr:ribose 5-phosphate isomerase B [Dehalococcoidia bacterium]
MIVAFGADHAGFYLKEQLIQAAAALGHDTRDFGTHGPESVDYPGYAEVVARAVVGREADLGVVVCSNGVGVSIAANKVPGVRCALCHSAWGAARARQHTDANVLALGAGEIGPALAREILTAFLECRFEGGRHARRLASLMEIERRGVGAEMAPA